MIRLRICRYKGRRLIVQRLGRKGVGVGGELKRDLAQTTNFQILNPKPQNPKPKAKTQNPKLQTPRPQHQTCDKQSSSHASTKEEVHHGWPIDGARLRLSFCWRLAHAPRTPQCAPVHTYTLVGYTHRP
jgi:hypothetical protein